MPNLRKMNLSFMLNRAYYEPLTHSNFNSCNKALCERRFQTSKEKVPFSGEGNYFLLKTTYPGLLIGLGNPHRTGKEAQGNDAEGAEINLGFTLDFVTGLPVIPGSTVKGVLRSVFKLAPEFTAELLGLEINRHELVTVENAIFAEGSGKIIFFDSIPVKPGKDNRVFGLDNITPHFAKDPDGLVEPDIHTMLKVIPNVVFLFRFGFDRWTQVNGVDQKKLVKAFTTILTILGIGAKTRVGFGALEELYKSEEKKINKPLCYLESM